MLAMWMYFWNEADWVTGPPPPPSSTISDGADTPLKHVYQTHELQKL